MIDSPSPASRPSDTGAAPTSLSSRVSGTGGSQRLLSLDALRGFDMFWIVGGEEIIHALHKVNNNGFTRLFATEMDHVSWRGVHFYDLIFPLFVFIVGVSLVFSLSRTIEQAGKGAAMKRIIVRSIILYFLGVLVVYGGVSKGFDHIRWMGVLQRIALCYLFAGLLFCALKLRGLIVTCAVLLASYWALTTFVPIRNFNLETRHLEKAYQETGTTNALTLFNATTEKVSGKFEDGLNLPQHLDFQYLPGRKWDGAYDPEGILSTLPAIATCLLGVFAGLLLKNKSVPDQKKVMLLLGAGIAGVGLGFLWGLQFPVIKKIWTSSYVLVAGGYACLFLAAFYQMVEIWQWRKWCTPFVWIGMNPITIYLVFHLVDKEAVAERFVGGPIAEHLGSYGELLISLFVVAMMFAFVRFLYQRKVFIKF